jgi:hypothetical protein
MDKAGKQKLWMYYIDRNFFFWGLTTLIIHGVTHSIDSTRSPPVQTATVIWYRCTHKHVIQTVLTAHDVPCLNSYRHMVSLHTQTCYTNCIDSAWCTPVQTATVIWYRCTHKHVIQTVLIAHDVLCSNSPRHMVLLHTHICHTTFQYLGNSSTRLTKCTFNVTVLSKWCKTYDFLFKCTSNVMQLFKIE